MLGCKGLKAYNFFRWSNRIYELELTSGSKILGFSFPSFFILLQISMNISIFFCLFAGQQLFLRFFLEISPGRPKLILSRMPDVWPLHCVTLSVLKRSRITRALTPLAFSKHVGFAARVAELFVPQRRRLKKKQILQNITALNLLQPNSSMHIVRLFSIHFLRCWQGQFV